MQSKDSLIVINILCMLLLCIFLLVFDNHCPRGIVHIWLVEHIASRVRAQDFSYTHGFLNWEDVKLFMLNER